MACRRAAVLLALLLPAGCGDGAEATLTREPDGALMVGVAGASGGPCLTDASITAARPGNSPPAWAIGRTDLKACARAFRVGAAVPGFAQRSTAPLAAGRTYCVAVSGPGIDDVRAFALDGGGRVEPLPRDPQDGC